MERSTLVGIVAVGVLGMAGAAIVAWTLGPPAAAPLPELPAAEEPPLRADAPPDSIAPVEPVASGPTNHPESAAVRPGRRTPAQTTPPSPALEAIFVKAERLAHQPVFLELPPDASEAEITDAVSAHLQDVDEVIAEYRQLAEDEDDPGLKSEAYHQGAMLYDQVMERLPPPPPPHLAAEDLEAWTARQDEMMQGLMERANALREDAALAAERP